MTRRSDRRSPAAESAGAGRGPDQVVAVVVPEPAGAVALVELQPPGARIAVVCRRPGAKDARAALDRALGRAADRGCGTTGTVRVLREGDQDPVTALLDELGDIGPDRLHTLDPDPEHVSFDEAKGIPLHDEPADEAELASDALAAARAWQRETGRPLRVDCLRAKADPRLGPSAARRYPVPVNWLSTGFDGRLTAFLPTAAGVVSRWERASGGPWSGPQTVEGSGLVPGLTVVRDPYGLPHLLGLRRTVRTGGEVTVDVVYAAQYRTGEVTPWLSLGGPNAGAWRKEREVGFPTAAFDTSGNLFVFVRNFGHSISYRCRSTDGDWSGWQHLGGTRVADELVAVTAAHGGVEVFARARDSATAVRRHPGPGATWAEDRTAPFAPVPGSLAAGPEPGTVLFRDLHSGEARLWRPGEPFTHALGDTDGTGAPAAVRGVRTDGWPCSVLVRSGPDGGCSVGAYPEGRPDAGVWWQDLGTGGGGAVAAAVSRSGQLAVASWGPGRELRLARRGGDEDGLRFGPWQRIPD
ncbi:hypothetical protein [Streptomyces sp. SudanB91_2054]|uniref:hypothetical protein n=1 Tax=Streptomyces sp. SudanB91_2054 TaxID=3035278 RepID=UPI0036D9CF18